MSKLDELVAERVMGWTLEFKEAIGRHGTGEGVWWWRGPHSGLLPYYHKHVRSWGEHDILFGKQWCPSVNLNDAFTAMEKASVGTVSEGWDLEARTPNGKRRFSADCGGHWGHADTPALALTFCALRAVGVTETEISEAMQE